MKKLPNISVSSISERDIDLLLLEDFVADRSFGRWFFNEAFPDMGYIGDCVSAQRSVTQSNGESDLEIVFERENGSRILLMIENKVAAGFQPKQAERYHSRATGYIEREECEGVYTVLTAPEVYFGETDSTKGFGGRVTYESLMKWFIEHENLGDRKFYKCSVLQSAIDKSSFGYQPVEDAVATKFWKDYWRLACEHASELRMPEPSVKPPGSTFIGFRPIGLPNGYRLVHKLTGTKGATTGYVDLQLMGLGKVVRELNSVLKELLKEDMCIVGTSGSASIRLTVPMVDPNQASETQVDAILFGLSSAQRLLQWFNSDKRISSAIEEVYQEFLKADSRFWDS